MEAEEELKKASYVRERRRIELQVQNQGKILQASLDAAAQLHVETSHLHIAANKAGEVQHQQQDEEANIMLINQSSTVKKSTN